MAGKPVEILTFEIEGMVGALQSFVAAMEGRIREIQAITQTSRVDLCSFQFNRDEAKQS